MKHNSIVPDALYFYKSFESREHSATGKAKKPENTPSLDDQVNEWVRTTSNFIVGQSPVQVTEASSKGIVTCIRTVSITYVAAVEQADEIYGQVENGMAVVAKQSEPRDPESLARLSDGAPRSTEGGLRVPRLPEKSDGTNKEKAATATVRNSRIRIKPAAVPQ